METKNYIFEEWKPIEGYEGLYEISNFGRVKSIDRIGHGGRKLKGRILKQAKNNCGYLVIDLDKHGKRKQFRVHRLVASAFIPNPNNYPIINHKDENKLNNHVNNLEWCTVKYNTNYGNAITKMKENRNYFSVSKSVICLETNIIYDSIGKAAKSLKINKSAISRCCLEKYGYKTAHGFHFKYVA